MFNIFSKILGFRTTELSERQKEIMDLIDGVNMDFDISENGTLTKLKNPSSFHYKKEEVTSDK